MNLLLARNLILMRYVCVGCLKSQFMALIKFRVTNKPKFNEFLIVIMFQKFDFTVEKLRRDNEKRV